MVQGKWTDWLEWQEFKWDLFTDVIHEKTKKYEGQDKIVETSFHDLKG